MCKILENCTVVPIPLNTVLEEAIHTSLNDCQGFQVILIEYFAGSRYGKSGLAVFKEMKC